MKRLLIPALLLLATPAMAHADSLTLTYTDAISAFNGLAALSSYPEVVKDGGKEQVVQVPYSFSVNTRIAIARDIAAIRAAVAPIEQALQANARAIQADPKYKTDAERTAASTAAVEQATKTPIKLDLTRLSMADIKLEINTAISPVMLTQLAPILSDGGISPVVEAPPKPAAKPPAHTPPYSGWGDAGA